MKNPSQNNEIEEFRSIILILVKFDGKFPVLMAKNKYFKLRSALLYEPVPRSTAMHYYGLPYQAYQAYQHNLFKKNLL